jgi:hypothetical protein
MGGSMGVILSWLLFFSTGALSSMMQMQAACRFFISSSGSLEYYSI